MASRVCQKRNTFEATKLTGGVERSDKNNEARESALYPHSLSRSPSLSSQLNKLDLTVKWIRGLFKRHRCRSAGGIRMTENP